MSLEGVTGEKVTNYFLYATFVSASGQEDIILRQLETLPIAVLLGKE